MAGAAQLERLHETLKLGLRAGLELGEGEKTTNDIAKVVGRFIVPSFGAQLGLQSPINPAADAEPRDRRELMATISGSLARARNTSMRPTAHTLPPSSARTWRRVPRSWQRWRLHRRAGRSRAVPASCCRQRQTWFDECQRETFGALRRDDPSTRNQTVGATPRQQSGACPCSPPPARRARASAPRSSHRRTATGEDDAGAHARRPTPATPRSRRRRVDVGFDVDAGQLLELALSVFLGAGERLAEPLAELRCHHFPDVRVGDHGRAGRNVSKLFRAARLRRRSPETRRNTPPDRCQGLRRRQGAKQRRNTGF